MAVDAVQGPLTARKLGNRLVVIMQPVGGLVGARLEVHVPQIVIAPVVAGIALGVGDGGGELMDRLVQVRARSGSVAGRTAGQVGIFRSGWRLGGEVAVQAILCECQD